MVQRSLAAPRFSAAAGDKIASVSDVLLAIETAMRNDSVYVARMRDGMQAVDAAFSERLSAARPLSTALLPTIGDLLDRLGAAPRDVRVAAFSQGPGSFTGLRIAATLMRMLHSTIGCEIVGVPTMAAIAAETAEWLKKSDTGSATGRPDHLFIALPAKRGFAFVCNSRLADEPIDEPYAVEMIALEQIPQRLRPGCAVVIDPAIPPFSADPREHDAVRRDSKPDDPIVLPQELSRPAAATIAALALRYHRAGRRLQPQEIVPLYVRRPECEEVAEKNLAAARLRRGE